MGNKFTFLSTSKKIKAYQINGIVETLESNSTKIFYGVANTFDLLKNTPSIRAGLIRNFVDGFEDNLNSKSEMKVREYLGTKFLTDQLMSQTPTAPICVHNYGDDFVISKGSKKIIALMFIDSPEHLVIITSKSDVAGFNQIRSDNELYDVLKSIDPAAERFLVELTDAEDGSLCFHYMSDQKTAQLWINQLECLTDYKKFKPTNHPLHVGLINDAYSTDDNLIHHAVRQSINCMEDIDDVHASMKKSIPNYFCTVYARNPVDITAKYINFVSSNLFQRKRIKLGYTHSLQDFSLNDIVIKFDWDGITSRIPNFY